MDCRYQEVFEGIARLILSEWTLLSRKQRINNHMINVQVGLLVSASIEMIINN